MVVVKVYLYVLFASISESLSLYNVYMFHVCFFLFFASQHICCSGVFLAFYNLCPNTRMCVCCLLF